MLKSIGQISAKLLRMGFLLPQLFESITDWPFLSGPLPSLGVYTWIGRSRNPPFGGKEEKTSLSEKPLTTEGGTTVFIKDIGQQNYLGGGGRRCKTSICKRLSGWNPFIGGEGRGRQGGGSQTPSYLHLSAPQRRGRKASGAEGWLPGGPPAPRSRRPLPGAGRGCERRARRARPGAARSGGPRPFTFVPTASALGRGKWGEERREGRQAPCCIVPLPNWYANSPCEGITKNTLHFWKTFVSWTEKFIIN